MLPVRNKVPAPAFVRAVPPLTTPLSVSESANTPMVVALVPSVTAPAMLLTPLALTKAPDCPLEPVPVKLSASRPTASPPSSLMVAPLWMVVPAAVPPSAKEFEITSVPPLMSTGPVKVLAVAIVNVAVEVPTLVIPVTPVIEPVPLMV